VKIVWFTFVFNVFAIVLVKAIFNVSDLGLFFVLVHILITSLILFTYNSKVKYIYLLGFAARALFMFLDLFASNIYKLPNSGVDSEMFYSRALEISRNLDLLGNTSGGIFSDIMGLLLRMIGDQRIVVQYINVLFGLSIIFIVHEILKLLKFNEKLIVIVLLITAFFPNSIIMSAIFLREIIPTFLVAYSLYEYIKWYKFGKFQFGFYSLVYLGVASMFHSGVIGVSIGYLFGLLFFNRDKNKLTFSLRSITTLAIIFLVFYVSFTYYRDIFFRKFISIDDIGDILDATNRSSGGSAYLTSLKISNPIQLVMFTPIKSFYFLASPLPMYWRGILDAFSFFTDSSLYVLTLYSLIMNRKKLGDNKNLIIILFWMLLGVSIVFGVGVSNAGTAIRHRQKIISLILIIIALIEDSRYRFILMKNSISLK
jgi:hypothetical protein